MVDALYMSFDNIGWYFN